RRLPQPRRPRATRPRSRKERKNSMEAIARQRFVRVAPRKMRIVADLVRGKNCNQAIAILKFTPKAASPYLIKAVKAAVASAVEKAGKAARLDPDVLRIAELRVDEGVIMKRMMPRSRGRADRRLHRTSHLLVKVSDQK
ncbi:MAG: 50S ribosomal protein L22, partial [Candidatus Edwardsbacteria bacterium]|nr:50S ribosomal protein L22 [Candidatus Edwardsbacteria bacterium]